MSNFFQTITKTRLARHILLLYCFACILMLFFCCGNSSHLELVTVTSAGGIFYVLWFNKKSLKKVLYVGHPGSNLNFIIIR